MRRSAFTLVELLVVIAIIGILVALLLPAVQAAREAGRRSQCTNNMKQLGLALHNHHDVNRRLPPGAASDIAPFGQGGGWGSSWMVFILPYIEQSTIYNNWVFTAGNGGFRYTPNEDLINNIRIPGFICPSSTIIPDMLSDDNRNKLRSCYVGISGADQNYVQIPNWTDGTAMNGGSQGGNSSDTGSLSFNSKFNLAAFTDGTTNTMMVGEVSKPIRDTAGNEQVTWHPAGPYGWTMGWGYVDHASCNNDNRHFNCVTVRYPINQILNYTGGSGGIGGDMSVNHPLTSNHPGGVIITMGDASARFISQTTTLVILGELAVKSDGIPFEVP